MECLETLSSKRANEITQNNQRWRHFLWVRVHKINIWWRNKYYTVWNRGHYSSRHFLQKRVDCFDSFLSKIRKLPRERRLLLPCTVHMCKVLLVNPATTSTAERSFSTARRIKTRMRSKMIPVRFNTLSILHTQKTLTDNLNLKDIANIFWGKSE